MAVRRTRASAAADKAAEEPQQTSSPPITPAPKKRQTRTPKKEVPSRAKTGTTKDVPNAPVTPASTRKRTRASATVKEEAVLDELPHNLGTAAVPDTNGDDVKKEDDPPPKKRARRSAKAAQVKADPEEVDALAEKAAAIASPDTKTPQKAKKGKKDSNYGLTPGQTPYPDYPHPTSEECHEVVRLLSKVHGKVSAPKTIPLPSLDVAGCGEVPSVLDALIRTRLSANTTGTNSSRAFQGLVKAFGLIEEGVGKGSVDWNKVRQAPQHEVFKAIERGGLAQVKSKSIQEILQMVYEENQARAAALKDESKAPAANGPAGAEHEPAEEKQTEITRAESDVLSLDHMHLLSNADAFDKLVKYPGIGPKTASCVLLFCLQRPSFAVDTHVFRLCQYLGWVPSSKDLRKGEPKVGRETCFSHCEVRIPDDLKYALHQLLIKHGKTCPRCRAAPGTTSEGWAKGCPIEHLVTRHGSKKGGAAATANGSAKSTPGKTKKKAGGKKVDSEDEESELSDVTSESDGELTPDLGSEDEDDD
ncbi:hypothetical protein MBLNU459_g6129t1 [Dothideomycetes sp. NU459]